MAATLVPLPRCRLCVAFIGAGSATFAPVADQIVGPSLAGVPVLASDGSTLVLVGHRDDGSTAVWSGSPTDLRRRAELGPGLDLAALVHRRGAWHLFGTLRGSAPYHAVSHDLVTWHHDVRFATEHPNLRVHGAAATTDGIVVLGLVVANGREMGWTLLVEEIDERHTTSPSRAVVAEPLPAPGSPDGLVGRADVGLWPGRDADDGLGSSMRRFRAREITFPLSVSHVAVGPAAIHGDEIAMAVASGANSLLARTVRGTHGRSWTLGLLSPEVRATAVFGRGRDVWVAGTDPAGGAPLVVAGQRSFHLDRSGGPVCAAAVHGELLVLARHPVLDDIEGHGHDAQPSLDERPLSERDDADQAVAVESVNDGAGREVTAGSRADRSGNGQSSPAYIDSISAA